MTLKQLRKAKNLTQAECAEYLDIPLRTYQNYENDTEKANTVKYRYMFEALSRYGYVDETHGLTTVDIIRKTCGEIFGDYDVEYCYLFGSYAKGTATETSDIDLLVNTAATGLRFYEMTETLREKLGKRVDVLNLQQLSDNPALVNEVLKDGIKIYE